MKLTTSTSISLVFLLAAITTALPKPAPTYSHSPSLTLENAHKQGATSSDSYYDSILSARGLKVKRNAGVIAGTVIGAVAAALAIGIALWVAGRKE
jgi:hypothetical protein